MPQVPSVLLILRPPDDRLSSTLLRADLRSRSYDRLFTHNHGCTCPSRATPYYAVVRPFSPFLHALIIHIPTVTVSFGGTFPARRKRGSWLPPQLAVQWESDLGEQVRLHYTSSIFLPPYQGTRDAEAGFFWYGSAHLTFPDSVVLRTVESRSELLFIGAAFGGMQHTSICFPPSYPRRRPPG
jgi:hypothetical protein